MKIIEKIDDLVGKVEDSYVTRIYNGFMIINNYVYLVLVASFNARLHSERNSLGVTELREEDKKELEEKYQICLNKLNNLNKLSEEYLGEKIYEGDFSREDVEDFFFKVSREVYDMNLR